MFAEDKPPQRPRSKTQREQQRQLAASLKDIWRATQVLDAARSLRETLVSVRDLAGQERWETTKLTATTARPRDWQWLKARWAAFLSELAREPGTALRLLNVRRWSERSIISLVMQTVDNSLVVSGKRSRLGDSTRAVALVERGFHELTTQATAEGSGRPIAVNVDPAESDLAHVDPAEVIAAATARSGPAASAAADGVTPEDRERGQRVWWYLLVGAVVVLAAETVLGNRLSGTVTT